MLSILKSGPTLEKYGTGLIVLIGVLLTLTSFSIVQNQLQIYRQQEFEWAASNRIRAFIQNLENNLQSVREFHRLANTGGLFTSDNGVALTNQVGLAKQAHLQRKNPSENHILLENDTVLEKYAGFILSRNPALAALALASRKSNDQATPKQSDDDQFELRFLSTLDNNSLSELETTGLTTAIPTLLDNAAKKNSLSIFSIKGHSDSHINLLAILPATEASTEDSSTLEGGSRTFMIGFFNLTTITRNAMELLEPRGIDIYIRERTSMQLVHFYASRLGTSEPDSHWFDSRQHQLSYAKRHDIAGWPLELVLKSTPGFRSAEAFDQAPLLVLLVGSLFTSVVILYLLHLRRSLGVQRKTERALKESESHLRTLFEHSPDIIMALDSQSRVLSINHPFPNLNVTIGEEFIGLLSANHQPRYKKKLKKVFKSKKVKTLQYTTSDATWWEARLVPIIQESQITAIMAITTDITENRLLQAQAIESSRLASIGVLAAGVAHEVNNPNNSIYFNATMLAEAWQDVQPILNAYYQECGDFSMGGLPYSEMQEKTPQLLNWILDNSERIKKLVKNLKHFARHDHNELNERVKLLEVLKDSMAILDNQINKSTQHFVLDFPPTRPLVKGNKQQLEQVFVNLIFNALQALTQADQRVKVAVSIDDAEEQVKIRVIDEGKGIPQEQLKMIREPFFTTKDDIGGIGLGLPISISIIENHAGQIKFESTPGLGTTVTVTLPVTGIWEAGNDTE